MSIQDDLVAKCVAIYPFNIAGGDLMDQNDLTSTGTPGHYVDFIGRAASTSPPHANTLVYPTNPGPSSWPCLGRVRMA